MRCSSWRTLRPRTPSRACCGSSTTRAACIAEAIIGKKRFDAFGGSKSGTYVRKPGDAQTWLSNADIDVSAGVRDWVQPTVLDLPAAKIGKVTVEIPGEEPLVIARDAADATKYALVGMPEGQEAQGRRRHRRDRARGRQHRPGGCAQARAAAPAGEVSVAKIEADGGLAVTLRLRKEGEDTWVSVEATGADGDAKKTAEDITKRTQGWEYKVPAHKAQSILKRRADLFEAS